MRYVLAVLQTAGGSAALAPLVPNTARPSPRNVTATADELKRLIEHAAPWLRLYILLCHDTALRASAALAVTLRDYDAPNRELTSRGKGGVVVRLPVSAQLMQLFALCPKGDASTPCVALMRGLPTTYDQARVAYQALAHSLGIRGVRPHDLRRSMSESAWQTTHDLRVVQALLGHNNLATTSYYLQRPTSPATRAALLSAVEESHGVQ